MLKIYKIKIALLTLLINLVLGAWYLGVFNSDSVLKFVFTYMSYAVVAVFSLGWGFSRIHATSAHYAVVGFALVSTAIVPFVGTFIWATLQHVYDLICSTPLSVSAYNEGLLANIFKLLFFSVFATMISAGVTCIFIVINILFFFYYRAYLCKGMAEKL